MIIASPSDEQRVAREALRADDRAMPAKSICLVAP